MVASVVVNPDLDEIRDAAETGASDVIDDVFDREMELAVDSTLDRAERDRLDKEQIRFALKATLKARVKDPLKGAMFQVLWGVIQGMLEEDRIGRGVIRIWRSVRELLEKHPGKLRQRAARALAVGNQQKHDQLMREAADLERSRGNG